MLFFNLIAITLTTRAVADYYDGILTSIYGGPLSSNGQGSFLDPTAVLTNYVNLGLFFNGTTPRIRFNNLRFGYSFSNAISGVISSYDSQIATPGTTYIATDQGPLFQNFQIDNLVSGTTYSVNMWAYDHGESFSYDFTVTTKAIPVVTTAKFPPSTLQLGTNGLSLMTFFEKFYKNCHKDSKRKVWTIGYNHVCNSAKSNLPEYNVNCTEKTCSGTLDSTFAVILLMRDAAPAVSCVRSNVRVDVTQNQFDAMVSFVFNTGCSAFKSSPFLSSLNSNHMSRKTSQALLTHFHSSCDAMQEKRRFTESQLFSNNSIHFDCSSNGCAIAGKFKECQRNCQYCGACPASHCKGNAYSLK